MKKISVLVLIAALAICSCQVKEEGELAPEGKVFTATMEAFDDDASGVESKTSLDAGGSVLWKMGDQVSIFAGSTINEHYQVTDASDGRTSAALNRVESPGFVAGGDIDNNVAFYPYAEMAELAKNGSAYVIRDIALPATQTYAQASFGNGAFPMTAVTSSTRDYNLKFKNVLGGLKLQLKGTATIASISITGNNNEVLCGDAVVDVSTTSAPSISLTDVNAKTVTLDCGNGVQLNETTATAFIIAIPPMTMTGGFTVTVTDTDGATMEIKTTKTQTITRSNLLSMPAVTYEGTAPATGHQYVDLGLTSGLKWATCNVGANAPEEYGDYFAWGGTEPQGSYDWTTCPFRTSGNSRDNVKFSKYNTKSDYGPIDNNTVLDPEDDAASVNWGGSWRMPTDQEWTELRTECTWTWTTQNGVNGRLVTGPNGNSIFLPAAGNRLNTDLNFAGSYGDYWSSSLSTGAPYFAYYVYFLSTGVTRYNLFRCYGHSVRPVTDEGVRVSVTNVSLDNDSLNLTIDETATLTATVTPSNATQAAVIWSSSDNAVATVDYTGKVTAVAAGTATITAKAYDGGYTATCTVTITDHDSITPLTFTSAGTTSISLSKVGSPNAISLEYKINDGNWTDYTIGDNVELSDSDEVYFRAGLSGNSLFSIDNNWNYYFFDITGSGTVSASGNIMSLLDRNGSTTISTETGQCFCRLFKNCSKLTSAPELPATTLASGCYWEMFSGCTSLTSAPELPATTLASGCYYNMFSGCISLTSAPELPATTLTGSCYLEMFYGCTSLTTAPELPATTLANDCYSGMFKDCTSLTSAPELPITMLAYGCYSAMFRGCTSLETAPELPATTLAQGCYSYMFCGCTSLTTAPYLPATTLARGCYNSMFSGCTNLTTTPDLSVTTLAPFCYQDMFSGCTSLTTTPELPATTLTQQCYCGMFLGCTSLTSAPDLPATSLAPSCYAIMFSDCTSLTTAPELPITTLAEHCYASMFYGCTSLTTAPELPATTLPRGCYSNMFYGCTSLTTAPELPATSLAQECCYRMFYGCTSLTTAPELPAKTLADGCYSGMFNGCSNISYIKMLATDISASDCLSNWVSGVAASGTFVKSSSATWDVTGPSGVPSGWTVQTVVPTPKAIDLGLPSGTKWASFNIGASAPEEYGDYFAWGETEPYYTAGHSQDSPCSNWKSGKTGYNWASYQWCNGSRTTMTKYNTSSGYGPVVDNKTTLDLADDAARANWGGSWRMPTNQEWTELRTECTWIWTTQNGVSGRLVTGPNGNSIFLPAAGYRYNTYLNSTGSDGDYWSSSLYITPGDACYVYFYSDGVDRYENNRDAGFSVRPVTE